MCISGSATLFEMNIIRASLRKFGFVHKSEIKRGPRLREFPAASINRLTNDWRSTGISLDSLLLGNLNVLRTRSRDLEEQNEYFQKFLTMLKANVIGSEGVTLKNKAADPPKFIDSKLVPGNPDNLARKMIEDSWWEWGKKEHCTIAGDMSWLSAEHMALNTVAVDGETIWRKVRGPEAGNKWNFALQPIHTDRIDTNLNRRLEGGSTIRMGIERDAAGRKQAVWLYDSDPTDTLQGPGGLASKRYPAGDFIHLYLPRRIGQTRGFPWAAAVMMRIKMLAGYEEAEIEAARAAACKMAFLTKTDPSGYTGENAETGGKYMDAEPGMLEELPVGLDVKVVDWNHPNAVYDSFVKASIRGMACGLNVSYPNLANDYGSVNFSSGRMARLEETEFWKLIQTWLTSCFHAEIYKEWLTMSLLSGAISVELASGKMISLPASKFEKFKEHNWHPRRWAWVDPTKEVSAKIMELNSGLTSISRVLAEQGVDRDELFDEIQDDRKALEARGITLSEILVEPESDLDDEDTTEKPHTTED